MEGRRMAYVAFTPVVVTGGDGVQEKVGDGAVYSG